MKLKAFGKYLTKGGVEVVLSEFYSEPAKYHGSYIGTNGIWYYVDDEGRSNLKYRLEHDLVEEIE
jgi:hypothetical protein